MRIKCNPKRNIKLFQLKDYQKGFISISGVKAIFGKKKINFAINLKSLVYTVKSDDVYIPVFGTGTARLDFEIDLSSVIVDEIVNFKNLDSGEEYDWHNIKVDIIDNILSYDNSDYGDDEYFEDYYDDWLICSEFEKNSLIEKINDFLQRDCESLDVSDIVLDRKNVIKMIKSLNLEKLQYDSEDDDDAAEKVDFSDDFYQYGDKEKQLLTELLELKLDFINTYLLSSDDWQALSRGTFLSIKEYMISKERYEILVKPAKYFLGKNVTKF